MTPDEIAPIRFDHKDRPYRAGANYYSYRTNTIWLGGRRAALDRAWIAAHELSHYYLHVSTPYGFFLRRLSRLSDSCAIGYCLEFQQAFSGRRIPYPIYVFSRNWLTRKEASAPTPEEYVLTHTIRKHVKPWSHLRFLLEVMEGSGWGDLAQSNERAKDFLNRSPKRALDFLLEFEAMEASHFPVGNKTGAPPLKPIPDERPACPFIPDSLGRYSAFGGHHVFEGVAQVIENPYNITEEHIAQNMDYWLLWLATISSFESTPTSQEKATGLVNTFLALCDLSLFTPVGALYRSLRTETMDWTDIHPGYRFMKALQASRKIGFLTELSSDKLLAYQESICARLGWPSPREFILLGIFLEGNKELESEHRSAAFKRLRDHSIYLRFMIDQVSKKEIEDLTPLNLPLIKPSIDDRLLILSHSLDASAAIDQMVGYFMPQWSEAVMVQERLNYDAFLPKEFEIWEPASNQFRSKTHLMQTILEALPFAQPKNFVHLREL